MIFPSILMNLLSDGRRSWRKFPLVRTHSHMSGKWANDAAPSQIAAPAKPICLTLENQLWNLTVSPAVSRKELWDIMDNVRLSAS